jgi:HTH-type transcriptional regulator, osmoprotectant uptake regulator
MNAIERDAAEIFQVLGKAYGMPDLTMKVVSVLYLQPDEIPLDELARKTGYSPASISNTVKYLESLNMLQRFRRPGTKKVFVSMEKDLMRINVLKLTAILEGYVRPIMKTLPDVINKHKSRAQDHYSRQQLAILESYNRQVRRFDSIVQDWIADLENPKRRP